MNGAVVVIFLRGGADGLALLPPVGDADYHRQRPRSAIKPTDAVRLDGVFGLHPLLRPWAELYARGELACIPAAGSDDDTRSHFYAQDLMDHGGRTGAGGWLARWVRQLDDVGPLGAVALGTALSESLRGATGAVVLEDLDALSVPPSATAIEQHLLPLYERDPLFAGPARATVSAMQRIARLVREPDHSSVAYPKGEFGERLRVLARLIKAGVGVRVATVDLGGWDRHVLQDSLLEPELTLLGSAVRAFAEDLGPNLGGTSIVVMTEFGRRVCENSGLGTDHGHGGALFVIGGGVRGGVHGAWPGISDAALVGPGDVAVANDYRDVVGAVLRRHHPTTDLTRVFPDYASHPLAI